MSAQLIAFVSAPVLLVMTMVVISLPAVRGYIRDSCSKMGDDELTHLNSTAQKMLARLIAVQFGALPLFACLIGLVQNESFATIMVCLLVFVVFGCIAARQVYVRVVIITNSELADRKTAKTYAQTSAESRSGDKYGSPNKRMQATRLRRDESDGDCRSR